ncbi:OmpA family protein [Erwinia sorbitola]|uniref:OmpA family protein n=1 Tax=Erwinia sorbitola TaxID=2681984 RepID=A0ABW9RG66_9GAMM|nr:OmpA family protein [Erwinia sorbitola]MTD29072.1 OmpA family protein [Erwinia sorbitola]
MSPALQRILALWAALLTALICLAFLPLPSHAGVLLMLAIWGMILAILAVSRHGEPDVMFNAGDLPAAAYRQPIVLVCGDSAQAWPHDSAVLTVPEGCWIRVTQQQDVSLVARQLLWLRPEWVDQLSVMVCVCPQQHHDSDALTSYLLAFRWKISQLRRAAACPVPLIASVHVGSAMIAGRLWQAILPGQPLSVWRDDAAPCGQNIWLTQGGSGALQQQVLMNSLMDWHRQHVLTIFTQDHPDLPPVLPAAMVWGLDTSLDGVLTVSLWTRWLQQHSALEQVAGWTPAENTSSSFPLPEFVLPLLPQGCGVTPHQRAWRGALWLSLLAAVIALCSSGWNNHQLVQRVAFDISHFRQVATDDHAAKEVAVKVLHQDTAVLDDHARNGVPLRLGLGLYQGGRLRLPLLDAIRSWVPPSPTAPSVPEFAKPVQAPKTVRLNSLSLFDSGKSVLNPGSLKMLVSALVDIKARPGWLIVVAGHTDSTGDVQANRLLSLKRAEALRDWMLSTSDVSESCFAVQGHGASRPIATNDTAAGRALNRRVEISLVPQADACQAAETLPASGVDAGITPSKEN